jgi:hypothetical protein
MSDSEQGKVASRIAEQLQKPPQRVVEREPLGDEERARVREWLESLREVEPSQR